MRNKIVTKLVLLMTLLLLVPLSACSTKDLMKMSVFSYEVKVVDENSQAIANAIVSSTDGQKITTSSDGFAELKFSVLGAHRVSVAAQGFNSTSFKINMPFDQGKTKTTKLVKAVPVAMPTISGGGNANINANININLGLGANFSSMMMAQFYPMLFQSMFTAHGYNLEFESYKPGEWTEWRHTTEGDEPFVIRKGFLKRLENKKEWWQMQLKGEEKENMIMEVLFSEERSSIRRMRQKTPDSEATEVPVSESWYTEPRELTSESIDGATTKRNVKVTVPAGTFTADLVEFVVMGENSKLRMWRVKSVPGGTVKTEIVENGVVQWSSVLVSHGLDANTMLNSY